ncbi:Putative aminopeptidase FrvX [Clostridium sp. USBA 49]|uniref:M42 family metallopeptidase n=1 Tax=Clostridium sp. USBA 49 TaxID=1881060 RepID=UPI00099ABABB|nr:M42 family metallopeptidase [Clostridium sp. USBA 49]SKA73141.1 Putative aminopeptidase FrvX [Clostridium sp. USBA 49]
MKYDFNSIKYFLENLLNIPSPTGNTNAIINFIKKELNSMNVSYSLTNKGALIVTLKGKNNDYQRTFSAHVDTLGAMVKSIKSNGALALVPLGGFTMSSIDGENCLIETIDGKTYTGTIHNIKPSVHISGQEAYDIKKVPENMEIILDEKVSSKSDTEDLGINVGDFISFDTRTIITLKPKADYTDTICDFISFDTRTIITEKQFIKSRHLDDKASVAILLYVIKYLSENNILLPYTTNFFISNYEEVGHGAAASIPENTKEFISVDMGAPGLDQNSSEYAVCICAKDSSGPYDFELRKKLIQTCIKNNINYKIDIYPFYGSDASAALKAGYDIKAALIGPGVFSSHSYERTHMDAIINTLDLVIKYSME